MARFQIWPGVAALALLALPAAGAAQDLRPLCAERPGKATPPCILDVGRLQLEVGLSDAAFTRGATHEDLYAVAARWRSPGRRGSSTGCAGRAAPPARAM